MKKFNIIMLMMLTLFFSITSLNATKIQVDTLQMNEITIISAINNYIENRGKKPLDIKELIKSKYLTQDIDKTNIFTNTEINYSYNTDNAIVINTKLNINNLNKYDKEYYINSHKNRKYNRRSYIENNILISKYIITALALKSKNDYKLPTTYKGKELPNQYSLVKQNDTLQDSNYNEFTIKKYDNGKWKTKENLNQNITYDGVFENLQPLVLTKTSWDLTKVKVVREIKKIECANKGATYNPRTNVCEGYTTNACGTNMFDSRKQKCYYIERRARIRHTSRYKLPYPLIYRRGDYFYCNSYGTMIDTGRPACSTYKIRRILNCLERERFHGRHMYKWSPTPIRACERKLGYSKLYCGNNYYYYFNNNYCTIRGRHNVSTVCFKADGHNWGDYAFKYRCPTRYGTRVTYSCSAGFTMRGSYCYKTTYYNPSCKNRRIKISPYEYTPYYSNNGLCYGDTALFCKVNSVSWRGSELCYQNNATCKNNKFNLRKDTDVCEKFVYSCNGDKKRYGLIENPKINNSTTLFNNISNKDNKLNNISGLIIKQNVNVSDNNGAMCVELKETNIRTNLEDNLYTIDTKNKSAF